jgi:PBSX family phage terminase large subunit
MNDMTKYKLFGGSMGSGKSLTIVAECIRLLLEFPGNCGYIGRHTYKDFKRSTQQTIDEMLSDRLISTYNKQDGIITLINGSTLYMGDLEYPDKFKSLNLGFFAIDEASETTKAIFDMLKTRLRRKLPGIRYYGLLASNPEPGWLKDTFVDPQDRGVPLKNHKYFQSYTRDNPHLPPEYIQSLIDDLPEHMRLKYVEGRWDIHETQIIDFNWIGTKERPREIEFTAIAVDPAISEKETADETVITVLGVDKNGEIYELEVIAGRWSFQGILDNCVDAYTKYNPDVFGTEQTAFQKALGDVLTGMGIPVIKLMPDKDKLRRLMSVSDLFEKGKVNIYDDITRTQIAEFPNGVHDDRVDAVVHCLRLIKTYWTQSNIKIKTKFDHLKANDARIWKRILGEEQEEIKNVTIEW